MESGFLEAGGCVIAGGIAALVLLALGIVVPLAGGTDFNGAPRVAGSLLVAAVWLVGLGAAIGRRRWAWVAVLALTGPLPLLAYSTLVSGSFDNPDSWATFARPPWELLLLMLSPLPVLGYGVWRSGA